MFDPATIPRIDGDMAALAGHADAIARAGAGFEETGSAVHRRWQGLASVYIAPEASELLAATGPIVTVTASIDEDLQAVASALRIHATEVAEIQRRLDALRARAVDLVAAAGVEPADPALAEREGELVAAVAAEALAWEEAQRRCAAAIRAVTGSGAEIGPGQVVPAHFAPSAPIAADTPLPVRGPSTPTLNWFDELADGAQDAGVAAVNGLASLGNAVIRNPGHAIAFAGGAALVGVSSAGVAAGAGITATGVGAAVGVPLGGHSALGVATGLGIAGAAGASIINDAMGDDRVEPVGSGGSETADGFTAQDVDDVAEHLARPELGHDVRNEAMIERIRDAIANGRPLTEGEDNFMKHETTEKELMDRGVPYADAHAEALKTHPHLKNYDPEVMEQHPGWFNNKWREAWGLEPR